MSRIRQLKDHEIADAEARGFIAEAEKKFPAQGASLRVLAHRPDILKSFLQFYWPLQTNGQLSRKLVELVRLSIARVNQCQVCLTSRFDDSIQEGLTEEMVAHLGDFEASKLYSAREKAAISYATKMASDHFTVGDDDFTLLYKHFSEEEVVELCMDVAQFIGIGRTFAVIDALNTACEITPKAA